MTDAGVGRNGKRNRGAETVAAVLRAAPVSASLAEIARRVGVSRVRVSQIAKVLAARGEPLVLARPPAREVKLSVRCREAAVALLDAEAAREGVGRAEMHRRLLGEALAARRSTVPGMSRTSG